MFIRYLLSFSLLMMCYAMTDALASEQICINRETGQECVTCRIEENLNDVQWGLMCNNSCDTNVPVMVCKGNDCNTDSVPRNRMNFMRTNGYKTDSKWWKADPRPTWKAICDAGNKVPSAFTASGLATGGPVALPTLTPQPSPGMAPTDNTKVTSTVLNGPAYQPLVSGPKEGMREYDNQRCKKFDYTTYSACMDAVDLKWRQSFNCDRPEYRKSGVTPEACRKQVIEKYDVMIGWMEVDKAKADCNRFSGQIDRFRCIKAIERDKQRALESTQMWIDSNKDRAPVPPQKQGIDKLIWDNLQKKAVPQGAIPSAKPAIPTASNNSLGGDAHQDCYQQKSSCEQACSGNSACLQSCEDQWYDCRWKD